MAKAVVERDVIEKKYTIVGLSCSNCAVSIEEAVNDLPQIEKAQLNFANSTITIELNREDTHNIKAKLQDIVDRIEPGLEIIKGDSYHLSQEKYDKTCSIESSSEDGKGKQPRNEDSANPYIWRLVSGALLFGLAIILFELPLINRDFPFWLEIALYGSSYILVGSQVVFTAIRNVIHGNVFDENFLMTIATLGAFLIQEFPEAVAVMLFYMIGEMFQDRAVNRSRRSIQELMDIKPDFANLKEYGSLKQVDPKRVGIGDLIVVKPGEKVPLDGEVVKGDSMVDTSALTGESVPRKIKEGDQILSGMINQEGVLTIKVTKSYSESTVARILDLVENAAARKAPTEKFVTRFAGYYTPVVVYTALALAVIPPLVLPGAAFQNWIYRALIFLVVSCPCALVVSIPLGFFGGIGRASRQGVLVKGGNYLEALNRVKQIVFDKTGTLTEGVFEVNDVHSLNGYSTEEVLKFAAYAEVFSNHPIGQSIRKAYDREIDREIVKEYKELSGYGITVRVNNKGVLVGNHKLMEKRDINFKKVESDGTVVHLAVEGQYAGYITISDRVKSDAKATIRQLKEIGIENVTMLTGDIDSVAEKVATQLNLDSYYGELLPTEKVKKVEELLENRGEDEKVAFVGDGINDAPVLARADLGVAMGGLGSDAAIEAADIVLMTDEPAKLVKAIEIARKTKKIVWQNIIMALGVKGIVLFMGAFGMATMWEAVFADVGVALLAVLNSMRIIK